MGEEGCPHVGVVRYLTLVVLSSWCVNATESPPYTVVLSAAEVEIRLYQESWWISAPINGGRTFNKSTHDGFHRLYQYIHGANEHKTKFNITSPILTTITSTPNSSDYMVNMYLPSKPPMSSPRLNIHISHWKSHCIAVRTFSGFAQDDNIYRERSSLAVSLTKAFVYNGKSVSVFEDKSGSYSIAQYNSSSHLTRRVNEVWVDVLACPALL